MRSSSNFFEVVFNFFLRSSSIFLGCLSSLVKIRLDTEHQLSSLSGSSVTILLCYTDISFYIVVLEGVGVGDPNFFLHISSSWVKIRLDTKNQLSSLSGSALKVCVVAAKGCRSEKYVPSNYLVNPNL